MRNNYHDIIKALWSELEQSYSNFGGKPTPESIAHGPIGLNETQLELLKDVLNA